MQIVGFLTHRLKLKPRFTVIDMNDTRRRVPISQMHTGYLLFCGDYQIDFIKCVENFDVFSKHDRIYLVFFPIKRRAVKMQEKNK